MRTTWLCPLLLLTGLAAQDPKPQAPTPEGPRAEFGFAIPTGYWFRGIQQENQGFLVQPWAEIGWNLVHGGETIRDLDLVIGQWNSIHTGPTGNGGNPNGAWFESDFYARLDGALSEHTELSLIYTIYHSPNGSFRTVDELAVRWQHHDEGLIGGLPPLNPSVLLAAELDGQRDAGNDGGIYLQLGVRPKWDLSEGGDLKPTLEVPVTVGLSLADYYEDNNGDDDVFGFLDIGGELSSPLDFLPKRMGNWQGTFGLHLLLLGDNTETFNNGDAYELIASLGFRTTF